MTVAVAAHANTTALPGSTSYAVNLPASISAGDLLVVWICTNNCAVTGTATGWTALAGATTSSTNADLYCFYKTASGSEGATATWTIAFSGSQIVSLAARVTGWAAIEASHTNTGSGSSPSAPTDSITTLTDNALVLGVEGSALFIAGAGTTATEPSGWTEYEDANAASNFRHASMAGNLQASHGSVTGLWSVSTGGDWAVSLLSISAAGVAGQTTTGRLTLGIGGTAAMSVVQVTPPAVSRNRVLNVDLTVTQYRDMSIYVTGGD